MKLAKTKLVAFFKQAKCLINHLNSNFKRAMAVCFRGEAHSL
jgi:hypothetical protein